MTISTKSKSSGIFGLQRNLPICRVQLTVYICQKEGLVKRKSNSYKTCHKCGMSGHLEK